MHVSKTRICSIRYHDCISLTQIYIAKAGAIPPLVALLRDGHQGGKVAAAEALQNLAHMNVENQVIST